MIVHGKSRTHAVVVVVVVPSPIVMMVSRIPVSNNHGAYCAILGETQ